MQYTGTCHCQAVAFTFDAELDELIRCNCSLCSKRNALMASVPRERFHVTRGQDALRSYRWNTGVAQHYFCGTCGIYVYHQRRSNPALLSVNACCIDGLDVATLPVREVDGKSRSVVNPQMHSGQENRR
ncbi:GFA family protein [Ralstonia sp. 24A2]|uniref:GFA family protein n=1 Tax=Ralstonia sp. 24A2 TaxID=3447364 RepID=UPI003F6A2715